MIISVSISYSQEWELEVDDDNIKIYTKEGESDNIKSYRAISQINHPAEDVYKVYIEFDNYFKWFEELEKLEIFSTSFSDTQDVITYYSIISIPWPFKNRDMVTKLIIEKPEKGKYILTSKPIAGKDENDDYVRLNNFYQITELIDNGDGTTKITLEGKYDAGGNVPSWLINMFVVSGPTNAVENIEEYLNKKKR